MTHDSPPAPTSATLRDQLIDLERRAESCRYDAELARDEAYDLEREADDLDEQATPLRERLTAERFSSELGAHSSIFSQRSIHIPAANGEHWLTNGHVAVVVQSKPDAEETMQLSKRASAVEFMRSADNPPAGPIVAERDGMVFYQGHGFNERYHALLVERSHALTLKLDGARTCLYGVDESGAPVGVVMGCSS